MSAAQAFPHARFFPSPDEINAIHRLSGDAKRLLQIIARYGNWVCWASDLYLAGRLGLDWHKDGGARAVRRLLAELRKAKQIRTYMADQFRTWFNRAGRRLGLELPGDLGGHRLIVSGAVAGSEPVSSPGSEPVSSPAKQDGLPAKQDEPAGSNRADHVALLSSESESQSEAKMSTASPLPDPERGVAPSVDLALASGEEEAAARMAALGGELPCNARLAAAMARASELLPLEGTPAPQGSPVPQGTPPAPPKGNIPVPKGSQAAAKVARIADEVEAMAPGDPSRRARELAAELAALLGDKDPVRAAREWSRFFLEARDGALLGREVGNAIRFAIGDAGEVYKGVSRRLGLLRRAVGR